MSSTGEKRTRTGCLTCRKRRVKCDETKPRCKNCGKRADRDCVYDDGLKVREYPYEVDVTLPERTAKNYKFVPIEPGLTRTTSKTTNTGSEDPHPDGHSMSAVSLRPTPNPLVSVNTSFSELKLEEATGVLSSSGPLPRDISHALTGSSSTSIVTSTDYEGDLIHHFTEQLGRWLDCGHLIRHFTLGIPEKLKSCPVLHSAVLLFAARHKSDKYSNAFTEELYPHCQNVLHGLMSENDVDSEDDIFCTFLILHFYEQIKGSSYPQDLKFLHGASSMIENSTIPYVDSSAPTFRAAAFWLYVRQWISSIVRHEQQPAGHPPPKMDFSRQLYIDPALSNNLTKWSNEMTWHTAQTVAFCFGDYNQRKYDQPRTPQWQELWDGIGILWQERPQSMEPLFEGNWDEETSSSNIWFQAEWHATGFGFYHLSSMLLISHQNQQAFTSSKGRVLLNGNASMLILMHGRKLYGACRCNPEYAILAMILCNSVLIWFQVIPSKEECDAVVGLLRDIEATLLWPTAWIVDKLVWSMSDMMEM